MDIKVKFNNRDALVRDILSIVGPEGRRDLHAVAAKAIQIVVQRHVRTYARSHHATAKRLGATPTGHLAKGARAITWYANSVYGVVEVAIPGITRAFRDLMIRPTRAKSLTIPARGISYGRTAGEMEALGWRLFSRRKGDRAYLFGRRDKETRVLFYLVKRVTVRQDRALLPTDKDISDAGDLAIAKEIMRVARKVCKMA